MQFRQLVVIAVVAGGSWAAEPKEVNPEQEVARLGAVFAAGVLDLIAEPKRDVTPSFAALVSAPIGYPRERRAAEFKMLATSIDRSARGIDAKISADAPSLVGLCVTHDSGTRWKLDAFAQGRTRAWKVELMADTNLFGTASDATHPPQIFFAAMSRLEGPVAGRLEAKGCTPLKRDAPGEVFFGSETQPVLFEAMLGAPFPAGSDHLLDFADDPDLAVAGLMPALVFAEQHRELPRPRAGGVLSLVATAEALERMGELTLVAAPPSPTGSVLFFVPGRTQPILLGFKNGYFTTPQFVAPESAITGSWSKWSWSLIDKGMPAEVLLDMSPAAASCLDALPKAPNEQLANDVQKCLDLSLPDAGGSFRVRRERWLDPVRAHELATSNSVESFCADQSALMTLVFFQRSPANKKRDAGPMMTTKLGWEERPGAKTVRGTLKLPADLEQKFAVSGFMDMSDHDLASARADLSFFSKLADFDRWELIEGQGPLTAAATLNAGRAPFPKFAALSRAARLHLRRAVKTGKLVQAASEVRQAARLAFNSETMIGQSVALNLLSIEWRAWDWAQKHGLPTSGWDPIDEETIARGRRVVRTAPLFFSPMASEATFARAQACDQLTICSAFTEVTAISAGLESILREPWRTRYGTVLQTIAKPSDRCSFALARYWSTRPMIDAAEAKRSRNEEVIAGGMMSNVALNFSLPTLKEFYPAR